MTPRAPSFVPRPPIAAAIASSDKHRAQRRLLRCLASLALLVLSSCSTVGSMFGRTDLNTAEQMMWSTYLLGSEKGMGAGFVIFRHDPKAPGGVMPVMVTAAHLLATVGKGPLFIGTRMLDKDGRVQIALVEFIPDKKQKFYVSHPEQDVAAFDLRLPKEAAGVVALPSFVGRLAAKSPRTGEEVSFTGFPEMLPQMEGLFPILRTGRVASYPVSARQSAGLFVIDADVFPGDSGAPVFRNGRSGRPVLSGMVIERVGADKKAFSHMAVAINPQAIRETLAMLESRSAKEKTVSTAKVRTDGDR